MWTRTRHRLHSDSNRCATALRSGSSTRRDLRWLPEGSQRGGFAAILRWRSEELESRSPDVQSPRNLTEPPTKTPSTGGAHPNLHAAIAERSRRVPSAETNAGQVLPTALNHASAASPIMMPPSASWRTWLGLIAFTVIMGRTGSASSISTHVAQ